MTPAISAGSRPLSAACWRMMSSWRSGSVISCTALSANGAIAAPTHRGQRGGAEQERQRRASAARVRAPAPRRGRAAACGRWCRAGAHAQVSFSRTSDSSCSSSSSDPGVCDRRSRRAPPSPPGVSWRAVRSSTAACPRAPARSRPDPRRRRRRSSRRSALHARPRTAAAPRRRARRGGGSRADSAARHAAIALADPRPQQPLEPRALGRRRERAPGDRRAVDGAAGRDLVAPARDDGVAHLGIRVELVHDRVGRERRGAEAGRAPPAPRTCRRRSRPSGRRTAARSGLVGSASASGGSASASGSAAASASGSSAASARSGPRLGAASGASSASASGSLATSAVRRPPTSASAASPRSPRRSRRRRRPRTGPSSGMSSRSPAPARPRRRLAIAARQDLALDALDRQRQAAALGVDLEDLHLHVVARLHDLARVLDVLLGELGDVHEALDALQDLDERAEGDHLGDLALELVADVVGVDDALPRVLLGLLEAQGDALAVAVDVEHLDLHGVADR